MTHAQQGGLEPKPKTAQDEVAATVLHIVAPTADTHQDHAVAAVGFVVLVETNAEKYRRTAYFSLAAATKAVERAHRRGAAAHVVLCDLVPVREVDLAAEAAFQ